MDADTQFLVLFVYLESIDEKLTKNIFKINVNCGETLVED